MKTSPEKKSPDSFNERTAGFFESGGAFAKACASTPFPFEIRPQQQQMASAVAEALADSEHLAVEAGTGVGKTFAYLVPLILSALKNDRRMACHASPPATLGIALRAGRVAVSTHTINLQEQLMFKDVPFLRENMGVDFKAALCKGRSNYICLRRLESANLMSGDLFNKGREKELSRIRRWVDNTKDGSLSDFSDESAQPAPEVWHQVCSEHDNCLGRKCKHYARCFLMNARAEAAEADILILNHHMFFSDLSLRASARLCPSRTRAGQGVSAREGGGILPECSAIVIDEAHNLEEVAGEHLGLRLSQGGLSHWLRRLYTPSSGKGLLAALKEYEIADETSRLWDGADHFFMEVASWAALDGKNGAKRIIDEKQTFKTMLMEQIAALVRRLEGLREATKNEAVKAELNAITRRGDEIRQTLDFFLKEKEKNYVYWIEREGFTRGKPLPWRGKLALVSAPIDVAPLLNKLLFDSFSSVVLTSATLAIGGSLEFFKNRIGADHCRELVVGSPFNYQRQMKVFIAKNMPGPNDEKFPEAASKAVAHFVRKTGGKAFVLFTNAELMRKVAGSLEDFFAEEGLLALVQGEGLPRHVMLNKFRDAHNQEENQSDDLQSVFANPGSVGRRRAEAALCRAAKAEGFAEARTATPDKSKIENSQPQASARSFSQKVGPPARLGEALRRSLVAEKPEIGRPAVLFGLDSFWMGVDVRGEALSNVIIVRLPFAVPDEPLVKARIDLLMADGKDAFREYSLPQAILKFRQGVGRLIRTANDEGIIAILDSRIISRWYGKYFLQALPECPVEQVSLFEAQP